ncbi:methyltransferase [Formosa sediminum]|uniref:tRNA1(Val) (adenine(37)-N6)-methyltransferase n=1 Tax=Formosa sediminum TaxID=2594004 RepID=A0A516GPS0_9FLAO|nr:methyltransferase [Formosa sediminum]QDO93531.1 methyltransferase [Formosa sediminum]
MSKPFKFKAFTINQDRCAMKIGTDGVLLGAWADIEHNPFSILDIGAGTGVIALMLAQRSSAELIDAMEIDDDAYEQCVNNFENAPWGDRLFCYHAALEEFVDEIEDQYDLIVSNPPFYAEDYKTDNEQRDLARFADALPFDHLIDSASKLLSKQGIFCVIVPFKEEANIINLASKANLFPNKILRVKGNPNSEIKRSLIAFSFSETATEITELIIETERHKYTEDYINLTKDFYLNM